MWQMMKRPEVTILRLGVKVRAMSAPAVVGLCVLLPACDDGPTAPDPDELGVLFIGNSLTVRNDLPALVERLLKESGEDAHVDVVAFPNFGLVDHWAEGSSRNAIALGGWDVVVLQQGPSATEGRPSLLEYSERFAEEIRAVDARPALYMVWPAVSRYSDFDGVSDSYRTAAELTGGLLFPVGEAWRAAWRMDASAPLYSPDAFHPSESGTYVAALVMVQQLTGQDPRGLPLDAGGTRLDPDLVAVLQDAAAEANAQFARPAAW
jgi:hypothetical protein